MKKKQPGIRLHKLLGCLESPYLRSFLPVFLPSLFETCDLLLIPCIKCSLNDPGFQMSLSLDDFVDCTLKVNNAMGEDGREKISQVSDVDTVKKSGAKKKS